MKPISTATHGLLDYLAAAALFLLPRFLGWWSETVAFCTTLAGVILIYSLLTRYEYGSLRLIAMRAHLFLDFTAGVALCAGPFLLQERPFVVWALFGFGILFLVMASFTPAVSPIERRHKHVPDSLATEETVAELSDRAA